MTDDLDAIAPRAVRAQAAVWVTDLHGPERDAALEARVRRWIAADPTHAAAFEAATEAWQRTGNLTADLPPLFPLSPHLSAPRTRPPLTRLTLAGIATLALTFAVTFYLLQDDTLTTGPGEQRTVDLPDGSQVMLNANSRLRVHYDDHARQLTLIRGEALFNVAKHQPAPFVVLIGPRKVVAVGTSFQVRRDDPTAPDYSITLVEGRIAVEPAAWSNNVPAAWPNASSAPAAASSAIVATPGLTLNPGLTLLNPGERLRISPGTADQIDHPALDKVTAWQRGQLIFDDASLRDAAAEFNRYAELKLVIDPTVPATLRVGGVFKIGDPTTFARAMANAYHLRIVQHDREIILAACRT